MILVIVAFADSNPANKPHRRIMSQAEHDQIIAQAKARGGGFAEWLRSRDEGREK